MKDMNGYDLSRQWFDFAFENQSKVKPVHGMLYFWNIELANRLGWPKEFASPASQAMAACGISSYNTYKKHFDELVEMGFMKLVRPSINQYQSCVIALSKIDKAPYKALDKALSQHSIDHCSSTVQSTDSINKPETIKPKTNNQGKPYDAKASENWFLLKFNELTGKKHQKLPDKAKKQLRARVNDGYTGLQFIEAITTCMNDKYHKENNLKYLTPEFITRADKLEMYLTKTPVIPIDSMGNKRAAYVPKPPMSDEEYNALFPVGKVEIKRENLIKFGFAI